MTLGHRTNVCWWWIYADLPLKKQLFAAVTVIYNNVHTALTFLSHPKLLNRSSSQGGNVSLSWVSDGDKWRIRKQRKTVFVYWESGYWVCRVCSTILGPLSRKALLGIFCGAETTRLQHSAVSKRDCRHGLRCSLRQALLSWPFCSRVSLNLMQAATGRRWRWTVLWHVACLVDQKCDMLLDISSSEEVWLHLMLAVSDFTCDVVGGKSTVYA